MSFNRKCCFRFFCFALLLISAVHAGFAGISRSIQDQYKRSYENKAMFLKIPIYAEKQFIYISGQNIRIDQGTGSIRYKVGDQLRVLAIDFSGDEIKFRMSGIASQGFVELCFKFDGDLQEFFPNKSVFDRALNSALTEGLKYTELEDAKSTFIKEQFERSVQEIAGSASIGHDAVLKSIAPLVPAYQEAQREIDTLRNRIQDVSGQLSQAQSDNRRLESESKILQAELARLKSLNAALQEKIDNSTSQISRLGDELRDVKGTTQGYQRELASIQRSLNLRVDAGRDLSTQIAELGQAMRKVQKENETLLQQISSLRTSLDSQNAANARLVGDNEELKAANQKMKGAIETLTSNEDSLARKYWNLKNEKEKLDIFAQSLNWLRTRVVEEQTEGGVYSGKANVYLRNVLLGTLNWSIPNYLNHGQSKSAEASFSVESIDKVRLTPEERALLHSFGEKLKIRLDLIAGSADMTVTALKKKTIHEIGERDNAIWQWSIDNHGTQDSRLILTAALINRNSNEIALFQQDHPIAASNIIRQIRSHLKPIPLVAGIILGFLLFGIAGIFRRHKTHGGGTQKSSAGSSQPPSYIHKKRL
jgi:predicted nuclease with TOPRIM domain